MMQQLRSQDRGKLAIGVIVLVAVFFFSLNVLSSALFRSARLDLTEDRLFTVSEGTAEVLAAIDEPVTLRYYRSKELDLLGPFYTSHAGRVEDLLSEYAERAGGMLRIERFEPEPFSPEENLAVSDGLRGVPVDLEGTQVYFGLAGSNSTDDREAIPLLAPERASFLEYDLTRLVHDLARPEKPQVAVLGDLAMRGSQADGFQRWAVLEAMEQFFEVRQLGGAPQSIDEEVGILLLAQPLGLAEETLYAVDQFVLRGGRVLAFIDPHAELLARQQPGIPPAGDSAVEALAPLLEAWGVAIDDARLVGDRRNATRVQVMHEGRPVVVDYIAWLGLRSEAFDRDDVVLANLQQLNLRSAGALTLREGATTSLTPILSSSAEASLFDKERVAVAPDPVALISDFEATGERYILAARLSGPVSSAFPDGPPESVTEEAVRAAHRAESEAPVNMILVADADILGDENWIRRQQLLGQSYAVPIAHNGDFAVNALDNLSGSEGLIGLRGRGLSVRPFEVLAEMQRAAEDRFRAKEQELLGQIEETNNRIVALQEEEQQSGVILTGAQQEEVDRFRREVLELRSELREVQHALRQDVERMASWIKALNIWAVPLAVGLLALGLAVLRRARWGRRAAASG